MRLLRFTMLLALAALSLSPGTLRAQDPAAAPAETTTLRVTANLTLVDVTVTSQGKAVQGLRRQQFHIFEDGKEQRIHSFDEHLDQLTAVQDASHLPPLAHAYSNVPARESPGSQNVLLLDELNTPAQATAFLRQQILEYLSNMKPGTSIAVFALGSRLRLLQGFTTDPFRLIEALRNEPSDAISLEQSRAAGATTFVAATQLARYLKDIPGRKNVIWFAGRFPVASDPGGAFSAAHATIYPVDARGLVVDPRYDAEYMDPGVALRRSGDVMTQLGDDHAGMLQLAEQTGGRAFVDTNGLREAIASAVETGSEYYTISYAPPASAQAGKPRRIRVSMDGASSYKLDYRRSYAAPNESVAAVAQKSNRLTSATLLGAPPESDILFEARIASATDPSLTGTRLPADAAGAMALSLQPPVQHTIVDLLIAGSTLTFQEASAHTHRAEVHFVVAAYDKDATRLNYVDKSITLVLPDEKYRWMMTHAVPIRIGLNLPYGKHVLRITIYDRATDRVGSLEVPVAVPTHDL